MLWYLFFGSNFISGLSVNFGMIWTFQFDKKIILHGKYLRLFNVIFMNFLDKCILIVNITFIFLIVHSNYLLTYYEFYMNTSWKRSSSNIAFFDCTLSDFEVRDARTLTHILFICRISFEVQAYILRSISLWNCNCNSKYPKL